MYYLTSYNLFSFLTFVTIDSKLNARNFKYLHIFASRFKILPFFDSYEVCEIIKNLMLLILYSLNSTQNGVILA